VSFFVLGSEGLLATGEAERAAAWTRGETEEAIPLHLGAGTPQRILAGEQLQPQS